MLSGHAYALALRAHILSSASVMARLLVAPDCPGSINLTEDRMVHEMLLNYSSLPESFLTERVTTQDLQKELSLSSRIGEFWIQYLKMVSFIAFHSGRTYRGLGNSLTVCFKKDPNSSCQRACSLCKVPKTLSKIK